MARYFLKEMNMKVQVPFLRTPYNYDRDLASDESGLKCLDDSLTQQQFKEEADINTIVDRFMKSGVLPNAVNMPQYVDYEGVFDFQSAMNAVRQADENFMRMDAKVRARFNNSPQEFLEFFANPENTEEAIRLGLAIPQAAAIKSEPDLKAEPTSKSE
jgi:phage internal scaffolding protein